jgi:Family of unknown function (DUF6299)
MKRLAILTSLVAAFSLAFAAPVLAVVPTNDTYSGRTIVGTLPFNETLDTTEATTDADDAEANAACGAPATDASVWYEFTAAADGAVIVDVSGSDYSAGVIVATGAPGSFSIVACGPFAVAFPTTAGETYAILAFDDQEDGDPANGGTLVITIDTAPPPPTVDVTVDPVGHFTSAGSAVISGTVTCEGTADFTTIDVELRQRVGRFVITGFGSTGFVCDGTTQPWSVEVFGTNGTFKGGHAVAVTFAIACGFECGTDFEEATVRLRR